MKNFLFETVLIGCLLILLTASITGCGNNTTELSEPSNTIGFLAASKNSPEPLGGPVTHWDWEEEFNTGDSCNSRIAEVPHSPAGMIVQVNFVTEGNFIWGNVAKMWIFVNGKQVAYDVGRDVAIGWKGDVNTGDKIEFKACAETHGDDKDVKASIQSMRW